MHMCHRKLLCPFFSLSLKNRKKNPKQNNKKPKQKELQAPCIDYTFPMTNFHLKIWHLKDAVRINSAFAYVLACTEPQHYSAKHSTMLKCNEAWAYALTALLIHILCVQKCVCTLFSKQIQTQDNDSIKDAAAEILFAIVYLWQVY